MPKHFLRDDDLTPAEQSGVLDLADAMKKDRFGYQTLAGPRAVAVLFDKPSLRTRVSFSVGIAELGGYPLVIDTQTTHFGRGETIEERDWEQGALDHRGAIRIEDPLVDGEGLLIHLHALVVLLLGKVRGTKIAVDHGAFGGMLQGFLIPVLGDPELMLGVIHGG